MHPTALPGRADQDGLDRAAQTGVRIGDHQLHSREAAGFQRPQKRRPKRAVLRIADVKTQHFTAAVSSHPSGDHHRLRHHPVIDPGLAVGGVEKDIREPLIGQRPVAKRPHLGVQIRADPRNLALGDARIRTKGLDQIIDLASGGAVQVSLHHHCKQALIDPATPLQQRRKERPTAQLGDAQLQITGDGGQRARPRPIALIGPRIGALMRAGADHRGQFGIDERLIDRFGGLLNPISSIGIA